ncbi:PDZ and LIM domain protein Zasp-like isoform X1 [Tigriopus californicus]|uniref:PDZ and LIM domain protein Zasp-like isoform X1 n=1 Tax=Tigriopus californicus TaxID=6832 RepID=UPI0027DA8C90|nr:PDZ and LIM domain protein Zasp-like isoform X1 [Tigriopus californicus]
MVQTVKLGLARNDRQPWGFRLHGGAEYGSPLVIQKVNDKSISEHAGLKAGDVVIAVNGNDVTHCRHKEAQDMILRCGNNFTLSVQRGGLFQEAIKTQLAASHHSTRVPSPQPPLMSQTDHGQAPMPTQSGGAGGGFTTVPHAQPKMASYNSPHKLYSEETMKEMANSNPDNLSQGMKSMGFNKKAEKSLQDVTANSQVLRALQEEEAGHGPSFGVAGMSELQEDRQRHPNFPYFDPSSHPLKPLNQTSHSHGHQSASFRLLQRALETDTNNNCDHEPDQTFQPQHAPRPDEAPASVFRSGGMNRAPHEQPRAPWQRPLQSPAPTQAFHQQQPASAWNTSLNANKAGAASNAEDFTKQFMTDLHQPSQTEPERAFESPIPRPSSGMRSTPTVSFRTQSPLRTQSPAQHQIKTQSPMRQQSPAQQLRTQSPAFKQIHQQQQQHQDQVDNQAQGENWNNTLNDNKAGMASNAQDFTKQFMSDMFGGGMGGPPAPAPQPVAPTPAGQVQWPPTNQQPRENTPSHPPFEAPSTSILKNGSGHNLAMSSSSSSMHQSSQSTSVQEQQSAPSMPGVKFQTSQPQPQGPGSLPRMPGMPLKSLTGKVSNPQATLAANLPKMSIPAAQAPVPAPASSEPAPPVGPGQSLVAPRRGRGELRQPTAGRVPLCGSCGQQIRGPFITALGKTWCPNHFSCAQASCGKSLQDCGFVEEQGHLVCEACYGQYYAPECEKCRKKILGNTLKAMNKTFCPECFVCAYCGKIFANSPFYLEDGLPYCEYDWNELFTTKCVSCGFPIEAGDRWVEALNNNYHSQCFNCTLCKKNLEGVGFFVKSGRAFCKSHARG